MRTLFHLPLSPFCRKVRLVLAEKRLTFDLQVEKVWERRHEYLELNPAATVPTLLEDNGLAVPESSVICEYLEEAYPEPVLLGETHAERVEVRRLITWFDGKFDDEVTRNLNGEKYFKRISGVGHPDAAALRAGYANLRVHLVYLGWLAETRRWLAGSHVSLADFAAAAHLSVPGLSGRYRLVAVSGSPRMVCADEVAAEFSSVAGGPGGGHGAARALLGSGFLGRRPRPSVRAAVAPARGVEGGVEPA